MVLSSIVKLGKGMVELVRPLNLWRNAGLKYSTAGFSRGSCEGNPYLTSLPSIYYQNFFNKPSLADCWYFAVLALFRFPLPSSSASSAGAVDAGGCKKLSVHQGIGKDRIRPRPKSFLGPYG